MDLPPIDRELLAQMFEDILSDLAGQTIDEYLEDD
jgi:hypothetical protein